MKASEYIRQGWCREAASVTQGGTRGAFNQPGAIAWCMGAAVVLAEGHTSVESPDYDKLYGQEMTLPAMARWNDKKGRTQAEVVAKLESWGL